MTASSFVPSQGSQSNRQEVSIKVYTCILMVSGKDRSALRPTHEELAPEAVLHRAQTAQPETRPDGQRAVAQTEG